MSNSKLPTAERWRSVVPRPEQFVAMARTLTKYLGPADTDNKPHAVGNIGQERRDLRLILK